MSRPFTFPARKKEDPFFNDFINDNQQSLIDLQRAIGQFELASVPSSASANGKQGMFAADENYIYYCTSENTWKRVAISTW